MRGPLLALALLLSLLSGAAAAQQAHSPRECREGGDFIRNAALSRDKGATREFFVGRLEEDLLTIRAFPASLRWFVHHPDDEVFLRGEVEAVFDAPLSSDLHSAGFLERCARRAARLAGSES
jgi:hypothetical protein